MIARHSLSTVETNRLKLGPLVATDLPELSAKVNNPRIVRNLAKVPWPYDLDDARSFYDYTLNLPPPSAVFAIKLLTDQSLVGVIGYEGSTDQELGYWLEESMWGLGIMGEAAKAVIEHAFVVSRLERLVSQCMLGNEPSRRILVGLGFRSTGVSSLYSMARKQIVPSQQFELTSKEWRNAKKPMNRGHEGRRDLIETTPTRQCSFMLASVCLA